MFADHVDVTDMDDTEAIRILGKSTRFLSRGSVVSVACGSDEATTEVKAWAAWAGHLCVPLVEPFHVEVIVREGEKLRTS